MFDLKTNLAKAEEYLQRFQRDGVSNYINGQPCAAIDGGTFDSISPVDLKPIASVAEGKAADIDLAANAASAAFKEWAATPGP